MKLALACLAVLFLALATARPKRRRASVADVFEDAGITELLDITAPQNELEVIYGSIRVRPGAKIYPGDTIKRPTIRYADADPDCFYTWMMIDPNFYLSEDEDCQITLLQALYVNIQDNDLECADVLAKFSNANPRPGTGVHDYVYLLWKQKEKIDTSSCDIANYEENRTIFNLTEFLSEYNFCDPEAGNLHRAEFPDNLEEVCEDICE